MQRVLAALGLTEVSAQRVGSLSGGERKRASIAVALLTRLRVLFLDEPASGLDPAAGAELTALLRTMSREGTTVVVTTHTPADLRRCDTVAFFAPGGRLACVGAPSGLAEHFGVGSVEEVYGAVVTRTDIPTSTKLVRVEGLRQLPQALHGGERPVGPLSAER